VPKTKVEYLFDPFEGLELKGEAKKKALDEAADYLLSAILTDVGESRSPVSGREFPELNEEYAKKEHGGRRSAILELSGDMLGSLIVKRKGDKILVTVPESEQGKADGHNNFSGKSKLKKRQFIPNPDKKEQFRPDIRDELLNIAEDFMDDGNG
jgi:hypothetical protein